MPENSKAALLILDMINLFDFDGGSRLARAAVDIAPRISLLRKRFDRAGAPVIYANDNFSHWQGEFSDLVAACAVAGGPSAAIAGMLSPRQGDYYILKPKHSAFLSTALGILLAKLGVSRIVLTGISVDSCVLATAQDANMREYAIWVPADCVASITPARKLQAVSILAQSMKADVRSSRTIRTLFPHMPA